MNILRKTNDVEFPGRRWDPSHWNSPDSSDIRQLSQAFRTLLNLMAWVEPTSIYSTIEIQFQCVFSIIPPIPVYFDKSGYSMNMIILSVNHFDLKSHHYSAILQDIVTSRWAHNAHKSFDWEAEQVRFRNPAEIDWLKTFLSHRRRS
jgi:hypothetical protein